MSQKTKGLTLTDRLISGFISLRNPLVPQIFSFITLRKDLWSEGRFDNSPFKIRQESGFVNSEVGLRYLVPQTKDKVPTCTVSVTHQTRGTFHRYPLPPVGTENPSCLSIQVGDKSLCTDSRVRDDQGTFQQLL